MRSRIEIISNYNSKTQSSTEASTCLFKSFAFKTPRSVSVSAATALYITGID